MSNGENVYYVYLHPRNDTNEVFYVGKGKNRRAWNKNNRSDWWRSIVAKVGYTVELAEKDISEQSAFDLEVELIKFYRECGHLLCNMTDGGEGKSGCRHSEDTRKRIAAVHKGAKRSEEVRQKMRDTHRTSEKVKEGRAKKMKPIQCSNGMIFGNLKDATAWLKTLGWDKVSCSPISHCCHGQRITAYGFMWSHVATEAATYGPGYREMAIKRAEEALKSK